MRLRLYDCRVSRLPRICGICQDNVPAVADLVNTSQRRLLFCQEAGDEGWYGGWAEILFTVSRSQPYITLPREIARLEKVDVCGWPVDVNNSFVEYLRFGNGRLPKCFNPTCGITAAFARNNAVTFTDLSTPPQYISVFPASDQDLSKRVFVSGFDQNNNPVTTQDGLNRVAGEFIGLVQPFTTSTTLWNRITGIQKDQTAGQVRIYQTDPATGAQVLLLTMEPSETVASYRRYYLNNLPANCCPDPSNVTGNIACTAIAKLDLVPVQVDTDFTLVQSLEALINECQAVRMSEVDNVASQQMGLAFHKQAIKALNGELAHFMGLKEPAISFAPFGTAKLEYQRIGSLL